VYTSSRHRANENRARWCLYTALVLECDRDDCPFGDLALEEDRRIADATGNAIPGTMRRRSFMGASVDLTVEAEGGGEMLVRLPATTAHVPIPGERLVLAFARSGR